MKGKNRQSSILYLQVAVQMYLRGMSRRTLADEAGITYHRLIRMLRGDTAMTLEDASKIKAALGTEMPLEELFERRNNP